MLNLSTIAAAAGTGRVRRGLASCGGSWSVFRSAAAAGHSDRQLARPCKCQAGSAIRSGAAWSDWCWAVQHWGRWYGLSSSERQRLPRKGSAQQRSRPRSRCARNRQDRGGQVVRWQRRPAPSGRLGRSHGSCSAPSSQLANERFKRRAARRAFAGLAQWKPPPPASTAIARQADRVTIRKQRGNSRPPRRHHADCRRSAPPPDAR